MHIKYQLDISSRALAQKEYQSISASMREVFWIYKMAGNVFAWLFVSSLLFFLFRGSSIFYKCIDELMFLFIAVFFLVLLIISDRFAKKELIGRLENLTKCDVVCEILDGNVLVTMSNGIKVSVSIEKIFLIKETLNNVFFLVGLDNYIFIPKREFVAKDDLRVFVNMVKDVSANKSSHSAS